MPTPPWGNLLVSHIPRRLYLIQRPWAECVASVVLLWGVTSLTCLLGPSVIGETTVEAAASSPGENATTPIACMIKTTPDAKIVVGNTQPASGRVTSREPSSPIRSRD